MTRCLIREISIVPSNRVRNGHKDLGAVVSCLPATDNYSARLLRVTRQGLKDKNRGFLFR